MVHRATLKRRGLAVAAAVATAVPVGSALAQQAGDVQLEPATVEHFRKTYDVQKGALWVPEYRGDPDSRLIRLQFVLYPSRSPEPGPPVVYLAGGPGGSGIGSMQSGRARLFLDLLDEHDFIAFDQRGTGRSEPKGVRFDSGLAFPLDQPGDPELYAEQARETARHMLALMQERGIDVRGLTTEQSADDLADLCAAVGAEKLVLWGSSYGTHLALATVRRHPDRVAAVILAGTEGPDHTFKLPRNIQKNLERLAALVAQDPLYADRMPDLVGTLRGVLEELRANPRTVTIMPGLDVTVGRWDLQKVIASSMGSRGNMQELPARLWALAHGEFFDLARWAAATRHLGEASAMSATMDCASWATEQRLRRIETEAEQTLLGATIDFPFPCLCEVQGMPRLDDDFRAPLHSDVPALFISGTLDGRTPVSNAREVAKGFTNHQHLIVKNASHGGDLFTSTPAIQTSVRAFLAGETIPAPFVDGPEWTFEPPYERSLAHEMLQVLAADGYDAALQRYQAIRKAHEGGFVYDLREQVLNQLGYTVMRAGQIDLAIDVFRLNTAAYPEAFNTWDSLGEGYMEKGELELAITYYEKSLKLNPDNANATRMIERIRARRAEPGQPPD